MKTLGRVKHNGETLSVRSTKYMNGNTEVTLTGADGSPYATVSINIGDDLPLEDGMFVVNHDLNEMPHILNALLESGLVEDTGMRACYGFVSGQPVWKVL